MIIILYAISLHLIWGATLLFSGEIYHTTAIDETYRWVGTQPLIAGTFFIAIGILAGIPLLRKIHPIVAVLMLIPQQFVLVLSTIGAIAAIVNGHYADMVPRPHGFIMIDKCDIPLATIWHTVVLFRHYVFHQRDLPSWYERFCG